MDKYVSLQEISSIRESASSYSNMGDSYICARFKNIGGPSPLDRPLRLNCLTIILCRRGSFEIEINMQPYHVKANTLLVISPGMLTQAKIPEGSKSDTYAIFVSSNFLVDINIDLNAINIRSLIEHRSPAVNLSEEEGSKLVRFFDLLHLNACEPEPTVFSLNVARSLCAGIFYQLLQYNFLRISRQPESPQLNRRSNYVHDFMRLVHLNYMRERSISFYASQLFISPKYLTLLVKEATGRSAAEWINEFVIIEAKNLLRFSGKNVQQVSYALNFPNQSAFGKYFKHLTGQSPTAYQKGR